jgi:hypothetical protein
MARNKSRQSKRTNATAQTTTPVMVEPSQSRSRSSLKESARKAVRASKSFVGKVATNIRKPLHEDPEKAKSILLGDASISSTSSTSTITTVLSLPAPEFGARFIVPRLEIVTDIVAQDYNIVHDIGSGPNDEDEFHAGTMHSVVQDPCDQLKQQVKQVSCADSALDIRSTICTARTDEEDCEPVKTSKMSKVRQWGKRVKAKFAKLSRNKSTLDPGVSPKAVAEVTLQDEDSETEEEDEEEDEDDEYAEYADDYPRCEFSKMDAIPDGKLQDIVRFHCESMGATEEVAVVHRTRGAWNFAAMVNLTQNDTLILQEYVVRIPGHGTLEHWTPEDAYMIEREVQLINHIRHNTTVPVPEIVGFDKTHDNVLGYPYILMLKLPGKNAGSIWFDQPYHPAKAGYAYRTADIPSTLTEKKRINFLRSLARQMTAIQALSFNKIGMLVASDVDALPTIGPQYHWKNDGSNTAVKRATVASTQMYALRSMTSKFYQNKDAPKDEALCKAYGNRLIFSIIFDQPVFWQPKPETFTIHHNDLDLQNILVDDDGNVTGIIDWDASYVAPRCIGSAAVPVFLRNDWYPRYAHDLRLAPHMAWNYEHYREIYAAAMFEAGNPDAHWTLSSALYQSAFAAITEGGDRYDLVKKLLNEIPNCRVDSHDFQLSLGLGWPAAQEMLKEQLPKIFEPKLPRPGLLAQLDNEITLSEWWLTFDMYLAEDKDASGDEEAESASDDNHEATSESAVNAN